MSSEITRISPEEISETVRSQAGPLPIYEGLGAVAGGLTIPVLSLPAGYWWQAAEMLVPVIVGGAAGYVVKRSVARIRARRTILERRLTVATEELRKANAVLDARLEELSGHLSRLSVMIQTVSGPLHQMQYKWAVQVAGVPDVWFREIVPNAGPPGSNREDKRISRFAEMVYPDTNDRTPEGFYRSCHLIDPGLPVEAFAAMHDARRKIREIIEHWFLAFHPDSKQHAQLTERFVPAARDDAVKLCLYLERVLAIRLSKPPVEKQGWFQWACSWFDSP